MNIRLRFPFLLGAMLLVPPVFSGVFLGVFSTGPALAEEKTIEERLAELEGKNSDARVKQLYSKIDQLEQALRNLTGLAEDADRMARQLTNQYEKFALDTQDRLSEIEEKLREGLVAAAPAAGGGEASEGGAAQATDPQALYDFALNQFLGKKEYAFAAESFEAFLDQFPTHEKAQEVHYWLGELYYTQRKYRNAARYYLAGFRAYEQGSKAMDNLFKLGMSLSLLGQKKEACNIFEQVSTAFPNAPERITRRIEREREMIPCGEAS